MAGVGFLVGADDLDFETVRAGLKLELAELDEIVAHLRVVAVELLFDRLAVDRYAARCRSREPWSDSADTLYMPAFSTGTAKSSLSPGLASIHQSCWSPLQRCSSAACTEVVPPLRVSTLSSSPSMAPGTCSTSTTSLRLRATGSRADSGSGWTFTFAPGRA